MSSMVGPLTFHRGSGSFNGVFAVVNDYKDMGSLTVAPFSGPVAVRGGGREDENMGRTAAE
jgi:hypothetical protein